LRVHPSEASSAEALSNPRWQWWEFAFLLLLAGSMLLACCLTGSRQFLSYDELITAIISSEPNLLKMLRGIAHGTEVNPPLFFILEWVVARVAGNGDIAMRLISGFSVALAVPILYLAVRPAAGPRLAAIGVALVMGLSRDVYMFDTLARYYGWMLLLTSLAAYMFTRFYARATHAKWEYGCVFLIHWAIVYTHLFGLFFSGMILLAHLVLDYVNRNFRWRLYGAVICAWATFLLWMPFLRQQLAVTKDGTYTPRLNVGTFFDELEMQTPLGLVLLLVGLLALLKWLSRPPPDAEVQREAATQPATLVALLALAVAWMCVPVATWAASSVIQPFYMRRYVAPCAIGWVFVLVAMLVGLYRLVPLQREGRGSLPRWCHHLAWVGVLVFCIVWQPLRARKEPRQRLPFVDNDYGHSSMPIVFEEGMDFLPRFFYGSGRKYVLVLDEEAARADRGYYTKLTRNSFGRWRQFFPNIRILNYDELPPWPDGFLVVDDPLAQTVDWLFQNKPELEKELLGSWGQGKKVYWVHRKQ
jgi:uncharacterized membrane protein